MASTFRVVLITAPRGRRAEAVAKGLVKERLAACVNVAPSIVSHYRWDGKMRRDAEALLIVKTTAAKMPALKRWIAKNHVYTMPEVLALTVTDGSEAYLKWLAGELA